MKRETLQNLPKILSILRKETSRWKQPIVGTFADGKNALFKILISTVLSLRTKDKTTEEASHRLFKVAQTPEELLKLPDRERYELINGQLVERDVSTWASYVAGEIHSILRTHSRSNEAGWVLPEGTSYQCFPDQPTKVRRADVSLIRLDRLSLAQATAEGHLPIAPDLAVEVVSPNDNAYEVDEKVQDFLRAGARRVWVVNPQTQTVAVHRAEGIGAILRASDELSGEELLPGFRCPVSDFFRPPPGAMPASSAPTPAHP